MTVLSIHQVERLAQIEAQVHYNQPPPMGVEPFILIEQYSPILISAPHGCLTFRNRGDNLWHEEDEYTAGMALLLSELCNTSVMATVWRTDDSDPNDTFEDRSAYKQALKGAANKGGIKLIIDLHGVSKDSPRMAPGQLVDLGTGKDKPSLSNEHLKILKECIEHNLGKGVTDRHDRVGFPAAVRGRSITAYAHQVLGLTAVQIEMKPEVRVVQRRVTSSAYRKAVSQGGGPYQAPAHRVLAMMQSLVDFIESVVPWLDIQSTS
jgi:hypothetical protein